MFQFGKVLKVFKADDKESESSDKSCHAVLKMWDEVIITALVQGALTDKIKVGDFAVVEIVPISQNLNRPVIVKLVKGKSAEEAWKAYTDFFENRKNELQGKSMNLDLPKGGMVR